MTIWVNLNINSINNSDVLLDFNYNTSNNNPTRWEQGKCIADVHG